MFKDCTSLRYFSAPRNQIAYIGDNTFSHLTSMNSLDLSHNKLTELSNTSRDFHDIQISYLYLHYNQLTSIQANTFKRASFRYLYLRNNQIAYIDSNGFVNCSVSWYLYLYANPLKYIRAYGFNGGSYYRIYMYGNEIRFLVTNAFHGISSTELDLSNNQISYIEEAAFNTSSVDTLDLHDNALTNLLPMAFIGLSVNELSLYGNKIVVYPGDALFPLNLKVVDLRYNEINEIPDGSFDFASALETLDLDFNAIARLQGGLFDNAVSLKNLSISSNSIAYMAKNLFDNCADIQRLQFADNKIYHVPQIGTNNSNISSIYIDLTGNPVRSIAQGAFDFIAKGSISLSTTSLQCGCAAYQSLVLSGITVGGSSATCGYPPEVAGISLLSTSSDTGIQEDFLCAPVNLTYHQPSINVIDLSWSLADGSDANASRFAFFTNIT